MIALLFAAAAEAACTSDGTIIECEGVGPEIQVISLREPVRPITLPALDRSFVARIAASVEEPALDEGAAPALQSPTIPLESP